MAGPQVYPGFYLIGINKLDELLMYAKPLVKKGIFFNQKIDRYFLYLKNNAVHHQELSYDYNEYYNLLYYFLREKNLNFISNEFDEIKFQLTKESGYYHFLFTHQQMLEYTRSVVPQNLYVHELQKFNAEFSADSDSGTALTCYEAAAILFNQFQQVHDPSVLLLLIIRGKNIYRNDPVLLHNSSVNRG
jgi:hypothetical protein